MSTSDLTDGTVTVLIGDVRERLSELPAESVHCVVTSPPYW
jgi:DNA modification methylase